MPLISCDECGNKVSDKAASCPSCGAPLSERDKSVDLGENPVSCPHCKKLLHEAATICCYCGAEKGYYDGSRVYTNKSTVVIYGIILPIIFSIVAIWLGQWMNPTLSLLVFLLMIFVLVKFSWQVMLGPRWWT